MANNSFCPILVVSLLFPIAAFSADQVVIAGAGADGVAIATNIGTVAYPIFVENTANNPVSALRVEITDLVGPDTQVYPATLRDSAAPSTKAGAFVTLSLGAMQSARLVLDAKVPLVGVYQSSVALLYGNARHPFALKITRTSVAPTVRITGLDGAAFEGGGARSFRFSLQETSGAKVTLRPPVLSSFSLKSADHNLQAQYQSAKAYLQNPDGGESQISGPFDIDGSRTQPIRMELMGLSEPGEYSAALDIESADGALPAQTFSIFVKRPWWLAALLVALGVGFSFLVRRYTRIDRPRLLLVRKILLLDSDVEAMRGRMPDADDQELLNALQARLSRERHDIGLGVVSTVDDIVNDVNGKLSLVPDFSNLRKKIAATTPPLADFANPILAAARDLIVANGNAAGTQIADTATSLRKTIADIDAAVRGEIIGQINDTRASMETAPATLSDVHKQQFDSQVTAALARAADAAQKSPPDLAAANQLMNQARMAAARILTNDLQDKLMKPPDMPGDQWSPLESRFLAAVARVQTATKGDDAMKAYEAADEAWLSAMIEAAKSQAQAVRKRAEVSSEEDKKAFTAKMDRAVENLAKARSQLAQPDLASARQTYNDAIAVIIEGVNALPAAARPQPMEEGVRNAPRIFSLFRSGAMIRIPGLVASSPTPTTPGRRERDFQSVQAIENHIAKQDILVTIGVGIVAVVLGVFLLWVDNLTWGSAKDLLAALLWGLGLHQVAGNALYSKLDLGALEGRLTGAAPAGGENAEH